jgi:hypothetical protein
MSELGPLALSLAKAQAAFPAIPRDKEVNTGSYKFKYAPLESIITATRGPLGDNGLAVAQLVDSDALVTMLLHESGAYLEARTQIPAVKDIQALGSAITYLRRYALTSILGIAAEDDDDGNRGKAAQAKGEPEKAPEPTLVPLGEQSFTGRVAKGDGDHNDLEFHADPNGYKFGFKLVIGDGQSIPQVICTGALGTALLASGISLLGQTVTVSGEAFRVEQPGRRAYRRLMVETIEGDGFKVPAGPYERATDEVGEDDKLAF